MSYVSFGSSLVHVFSQVGPMLVAFLSSFGLGLRALGTL